MDSKQNPDPIERKNHLIALSKLTVYTSYFADSNNYQQQKHITYDTRIFNI